MKILCAENLHKMYGEGSNPVVALRDVSLVVEKGEFVAIVGTSGSGKSTLLNILGGLDRPTRGSVLIDDTEITEMNDHELTLFRREKIGFVFQSYNLVPILNAYENVALPAELGGNDVDENLVDEIFRALQIEGKMFKYPSQLSGGEQQRVAIARSLANKPALILADEPTGNLDSKSSRQVIDLLFQCKTLFDQTLVMITHNDTVARGADRVIHIEDGKVII
jgi:putative ABC transport system ATP-binding protein